MAAIARAESHKLNRCRLRLVLLLTLLVTTLLTLTSCSSSYDVTVENATGREIAVMFFDGHEEWHLRPCSVRSERPLSWGPPGLTGVEFRLKDSDGNSLGSIKVKAEKIHEGLYRLRLRIPENQPGACPAPVQGTYVLSVKNYIRDSLEIWYKRQFVGSVGSNTTEQFGPLVGSWRDIEEIVARRSGGEETSVVRCGAAGSDYDLGQVPIIRVSILPDCSFWTTPPAAGGRP